MPRTRKPIQITRPDGQTLELPKPMPEAKPEPARDYKLEAPESPKPLPLKTIESPKPLPLSSKTIKQLERLSVHEKNPFEIPRPIFKTAAIDQNNTLEKLVQENAGKIIFIHTVINLQIEKFLKIHPSFTADPDTNLSAFGGLIYKMEPFNPRRVPWLHKLRFDGKQVVVITSQTFSLNQICNPTTRELVAAYFVTDTECYAF